MDHICYADSKGYLDYSLGDLESMPTIEESHTADLKYQNSNKTERVWLERVGIDGGEICDNKVTVEFYIPATGTWRTIAEYEAL